MYNARRIASYSAGPSSSLDDHPPRVKTRFNLPDDRVEDAVNLKILWRVNRRDARGLQSPHVGGRNDAADNERHVFEAGRAQEMQHLLSERDMRAGEDRQADAMDARFGRLDNFGRGEPDAVVNDVHAGVRGARRDLLRAIGMAIEARLADKKPEPAAELEGDAFNFAAKRVEVACFLTRARRDAGRRTKDPELRTQSVGPFARRGPGFGRLDRGGHDIDAARRRLA